MEETTEQPQEPQPQQGEQTPETSTEGAGSPAAPVIDSPGVVEEEGGGGIGTPVHRPAQETTTF